MSTPTVQLPQELKDAIEMEANLYEHESQRAVSADEYIRIATTYALRAYRAEQEAVRLARLLRYVKGCLEQEFDRLEIIDFMNKQLNPPAGDNTKTENDDSERSVSQ